MPFHALPSMTFHALPRPFHVLRRFALILFPTIGFSLAFTVLMPAQILYATDARWPFFMPFWALLGDFDIDAVSEFTPEDAWWSDHLTHALLWAYVFISTVVFVNLLIAQMGQSYSDVLEAAFQYHNWTYMELVRDAKDQLSPWQPPLNIWEIWTYYWMRLRGGCRRPRHETPKGFRWDTDVAHGRQVIQMQRLLYHPPPRSDRVSAPLSLFGR